MAERIVRAVAALAGKQHGYVTREQLLAIGMGSEGIKYWVKIGRLIRVYAGVYAVGHLPVAPEARAHAAVLACGDKAVLSHSSAARLWTYTKHWSMPYEVIAKSDRRREGIRVHRATGLTRRDTTRQLGVPVTSPARTVFDMTPRIKTDKALRRLVNDARLTKTFHLSDLAELLDRHPHAPATRRLRPFLAATGATRSELEDKFVAFARLYGLPEPTINTPMGRTEPDILFPEERVIVEIDSWRFHSDRGAFESDRDRDAERLAAGFETVRVTEERLDNTPAREAERLHAILRARRRAA